MSKGQDPEIVRALLAKEAQNTWLMDYDQFINTYKLQEVTETLSFEPNTKEFHPKGLFSEDIFGTVTSQSRFTTMAYINLHTSTIHPVVYKEVIAKRRLNVEILAGRKYAVWNNKENTFEAADATDPNADTGFAFFTSHIQEMWKAKINEKSLTARNNRDLLKKYNDNLFCSKILVLPAGLRDMDLTSDKLTKDDINSAYTSIISYSKAFAGNTNTSDRLFDDPRWRLQQKHNEIYEYIILEILKGKKGFIEGHYASRRVTVSTRNVLSVAVAEGVTPDDAKCLKSDESMMGIVNAVKAFQPFCNHFIRTVIFGDINTNSTTTPAIDPKTMESKYIELDTKTAFKYQDKKKIDILINKFKYAKFINSHVSINDSEGKMHYLILKYEDGADLYLVNSIDQLREKFPDIKPKDLTPVTWGEIIYIGLLDIVKDKHVYISRYPANGEGSIYPSKIKLTTTNPSHYRKVYNSAMNDVLMECTSYPEPGKEYFGAFAVSPDKLSANGWLGGDYDGDTISITGVFSEEGNTSIAQFLDSARCVINGNNELRYGIYDTVEKTLGNLTMDIPT